MVHRTDMVIDGHRVWLQDDTDASTSPVNVATRIERAIQAQDAGPGVPVPDDSWRPRVAAIGKRTTEAIEDAQKQLDTAMDAAQKRLDQAKAGAESLAKLGEVTR